MCPLDACLHKCAARVRDLTWEHRLRCSDRLIPEGPWMRVELPKESVPSERKALVQNAENKNGSEVGRRVANKGEKK